MIVSIGPSLARGRVKAPPSKSMAHRLLMAAGLTDGQSMISGIAYSEDILATLDCLEALGARIYPEGDTVRIWGTDPAKTKAAVLQCRECGSSLRFFLPAALLSGEWMRLEGSEKLFSRPLGVYEDLMEKQGLAFRKDRQSITVRGPLRADIFEVPGHISSQFISGLLFALPHLKEDSEIRILPPVESRPYIDMTLAALRAFGIFPEHAQNRIRIRGGQGGRPGKMAVEGDYANAAFLEALNLLGGTVEISGLREDSLQGDRIYQDYFEALKKGSPTLDLRDCPDLGPVLMAMAGALNGAILTGTRRLAIKESDRGRAMAEELAKFGICVKVMENTITVEAGKLKTPKEMLDSHHDHRIAMALSLLCTRTGGTIRDAQAVNKSFPGFFDVLKGLGIEAEYALDQ